jgi:homoserine dehydrogenase
MRAEALACEAASEGGPDLAPLQPGASAAASLEAGLALARSSTAAARRDADGQRPSLLLFGKGNVGGELLAQLSALRAPPLLGGLCDSRRALFDPRGLDPARWKQALLAQPAAPATAARAAALLDQLAGCPSPKVLVDCSAAEGMEEIYRAAFARGVHVVTANKKPLAIDWPARQRLLAAARESGCAFLYETTVGAALPVIGPLQDLVATSDEVERIEASLSGTLGYLCGELQRGVPLSTAVARARALGYTEPHPRDDLSGADVARKALILAREIGLPLSAADVALAPFVDPGPSGEGDPERFLAKLRVHDDALAARVREHGREGRVLRYLARIKAGPRPRVMVGPAWVAADHPAARLQGTEAMVAIWSRRYPGPPLRVQGPGAGAAVTAAGVLADVLRIARRT